MNQRLPISVHIIACNEADRIGKTIASVRDWVDEVIVVDSGSTDDTVSISEFFGAVVIHNPWPGYGMQKRFAEEQCRNRWLLSLDADEELTPELADEIRAIFAGATPTETGFVLRIRDLLPGETKLSRFAHTNYVLRLYDFKKARFSESPVHDSVIVEEGTTRILEHPVLHRSFRSISHIVEKMNAYTTVQALELAKKRRLRFPVIRMIFEFPLAFLKCYLLRGYVMRGTIGFSCAIIYAMGRVVRVAKYIEIIDNESAIARQAHTQEKVV